MSRTAGAGRRVYRLPPCSPVDVEGMERWLSEMAERGLLLEKDGIFAGIAVFERGRPRRVEYRLEAADRGTGMWAENGGEPDPEAVALCGRYGWEYTAKRGDFYIYRFVGIGEGRGGGSEECRAGAGEQAAECLIGAGEQAVECLPGAVEQGAECLPGAVEQAAECLPGRGAARELNTDPEVQALTIQAVKKRQEAALFHMCFWALIYPLVRLRGGILLAMVQAGTWFLLLGAVIVLWFLADAAWEVLSLGRLRRRLLAEARQRGRHPAEGRQRGWHPAEGRQNRWYPAEGRQSGWHPAEDRSRRGGGRGRNSLIYYGKNCAKLALLLAWFCVLFSRWSASALDEENRPLSDFAGKPPFAVMEELAGEGAYGVRRNETDLGYNYYREWTDWLAPVNIRWAEHATVTRADGSVIGGGLYVDYHEMISPRLARRLAVEYEREDMRGKEAGYLETSLPVADYAAAFRNGTTGFPAAVIQDGRIVVHVTFFQVPRTGGEIPLEEWLGIMADKACSGAGNVIE